MPEVKNVSPVLPIAAATPVQGSSSNAAVSQGNDSQPAFSQVLRDKQAAANASTNTSSNNTTDSAQAQAKDSSSKADGPDAKAESTQKDVATDAAAGSEAPAMTPAEMAQLLATAGLMASAQNATTTTAGANKGAADAELAVDTAGKAATDPNVMTVLTGADKTAAADAGAAASLAAGTATTTSSAEQALAAQSQSTRTDGKGNQTSTSGGDQQSAERQSLLAVANQGDADKAAATATDSEASFSAALDRASQNGSTPLTSAVSQTQSSQAAATHTINTPVGRSGWADEVGQRVLWTAKSDSSRADLVLTPPQLGRIEVSIHVNGDQASASFMAANPIAREALQDAMPKLRELLSQAGIQLGQADVSDGQSGQSGAQSERRQAGGGGNGTGMLVSDSLSGGTSSGWAHQGSGLVDTFA